jgi:ABC-type branched-subunit amino acid transport system substrate-binding protein
MKRLTRLSFVVLLLAVLSSFCTKRQEIPLYHDTGEEIPAVDSLYASSKSLYKSAQYNNAIELLQTIIQKYPTSDKVDDALSLLLLSKYRLKDYRGVLSSMEGKEKLYHGRPAEPDILYIQAQSLEKIDEKYEAAKTYYKIVFLPVETNLKKKSDERLKKLISKELTFPDLKKLASNYAETSMGAYTMYFAALRGIEEGRENDAKSIYKRMKELYPQNNYTKDIAELLKSGQPVTFAKGAIGFLAPLTEEYSVFGRRVQKGIELAFKGRKLKVISRDTKGSPINAIQETVDLINKEHVYVILGPILSMPMIAASGIANLLNIPIISPTATEDDIASIGPFVFQLNVGLGAQAREMAKLATKELGYTKFAVLHPDDAYGNSLTEIFIEEVIRGGGIIVAKQSYPDGTTDFKYQMKYIKDNKPEAVYIPCYPNEAILIAPQLKYYKIRARILGADGWNDESVPIKGEDYVEGALFTGNPASAYTSTDAYREFRRHFFAEYGTEPSREAALGYDAGILLLKAMDGGAKNSKELAEKIGKMEPFVGASGVVNPRGVFEGSVPFLTIKNGDIVKFRRK